MAISFIAKETNTNTSNSVQVTVPSGTQDDDLMLACVAIEDFDNTIDTPSGWTKMSSGAQFFCDDGRDETAGATYYKTASSEPANYTWNGNTSPGDNMAGAILTFRGAEIASNPVESLSDFNDVVNATATYNLISCSTPNCLLVACAVWTDPGTSLTLTTPSGYTERATDSVTEAGIYVFTRAVSDAGDYGPFTATFSSSTPHGTRHLAIMATQAGPPIVATTLPIQQQLNFRLGIKKQVSE